MRLRYLTPPEWFQTVSANFDAFLIDHAACERKASGTALSLVAHYPNRPALVSAMIDMAIEELDHFRQVSQIIAKRGLMLGPDTKSPYMGQMQKLLRTDPEGYFLDRLLVIGVVEARGCERFGILAKELPAGELKDFYLEITRSEARHHGLFVRLAKLYFPPEQIDVRLDEILDRESEIIQTLPLRAAVH